MVLHGPWSCLHGQHRQTAQTPQLPAPLPRELHIIKSHFKGVPSSIDHLDGAGAHSPTGQASQRGIWEGVTTLWVTPPPRVMAESLL